MRTAMKAMTAVLITVVLAAPFRAYAQTPAPTPAPAEPAASPAPSPSAGAPAGGIDLSKLTPEQQAALQASIIKASQNPVGNIAIIPFQQNFNYGVGPYTRFQYNLNIQPVVPFMLSPNLNLIARTIIPIINQPSFAPPQVCASQFGCGSTFGIGDIQEQIFFAPKTKPGAIIWGAGPQFLFPTASPDTLGTGKWSVGPAVVGLVMPGPFVMGVLVTQLWSFAGKSKFPGRQHDVHSALYQLQLEGRMGHHDRADTYGQLDGSAE